MAVYKQARKLDQEATRVPTVAIGNAPAIGAILYLRLWESVEPGKPPNAFQEIPQSALYLVADLIAASGGVPAESSGQIYVAQFPALQSAILAARRLQWAAQGFSEIESLRETAVAIQVQHAEDSLGAMADGSSPHALDQAAPGQILLSSHAAKFLENTAGFSLGSPSQAGLQELLWRSPDDQTTRTSDERAIAWFIEQKGPEAYAQAYPHQNAEDAEASPRPKDESSYKDEDSEASERRRAHLARQSSAQRLWLIGGAVAAVLIFAAIAVFHSFGGSEPSPAANPPVVDNSSAVQASSPANESAATTKPQIPAVKESPKTPDLHGKDKDKDKSKTKPQPAQNQAPPGETKEPVQAKVEPPKAAPKPVEQPKGNCELGQNDIPGQLDAADRNYARGKYDAALRQFQEVLACESGNARALEGVNRVRAAQAAEGPGI